MNHDIADIADPGREALEQVLAILQTGEIDATGRAWLDSITSAEPADRGQLLIETEDGDRIVITFGEQS